MIAKPSSATVLLARQPIFDRKLKVHGYELLYREGSSKVAGEVGPRESAATLMRAIVEIGLEKLVGSKTAYVNVPSYLLGEPALRLLPKDRVVLEILENVEPTALAIDQVRELAELGYRVALDDFVFGSPQVEFMPYVKIVKVDLTENKGRLLNQTVDMLKKCRVKLLAEKVETLAMYNQCQVLGFHYFQGYFCAKPEIVSGKTVPAQVTTLVNLLNRIQDADISLAELESLIAPDLGLTYRLLRMVNSVSINPNDVVDSLRSALLILGIERVRSLASLLALAAMDATPDELMVTAMVRAKMCESIAPLMGHRDPSRHFTVGLLSVLDKILDMPMAEILSQIPLSPELKAALADESAQGPLRETLALAEAFEAGNWQLIESNYSDRPEVSECYLDAVEWADRTATTIAA